MSVNCIYCNILCNKNVNFLSPRIVKFNNKIKVFISQRYYKYDKSFQLCCNKKLLYLNVTTKIAV